MEDVISSETDEGDVVNALSECIAKEHGPCLGSAGEIFVILAAPYDSPYKQPISRTKIASRCEQLGPHNAVLMPSSSSYLLRAQVRTYTPTFQQGRHAHPPWPLHNPFSPRTGHRGRACPRRNLDNEHQKGAPTLTTPHLLRPANLTPTATASCVIPPAPLLTHHSPTLLQSLPNHP